MKVTVKDCLQLESFRKCIVVAGEKHMDNRIKAVSVLDAATPEEALACNGNRRTDRDSQVCYVENTRAAVLLVFPAVFKSAHTAVV